MGPLIFTHNTSLQIQSAERSFDRTAQNSLLLKPIPKNNIEAGIPSGIFHPLSHRRILPVQIDRILAGNQIDVKPDRFCVKHHSGGLDRRILKRALVFQQHTYIVIKGNFANHSPVHRQSIFCVEGQQVAFGRNKIGILSNAPSKTVRSSTPAGFSGE